MDFSLHSSNWLAQSLFPLVELIVEHAFHLYPQMQKLGGRPRYQGKAILVKDIGKCLNFKNSFLADSLYLVVNQVTCLIVD